MKVSSKVIMKVSSKVTPSQLLAENIRCEAGIRKICYLVDGWYEFQAETSLPMSREVFGVFQEYLAGKWIQSLFLHVIAIAITNVPLK